MAQSFPTDAAGEPAIVRAFPTAAIRTGDVIDALPEVAAAKLRGLRQGADDAGALARSVFEAREEARRSRMEIQARIALLTKARSVGGHSLREDDPTVVAEQKKLDKASAEFKRLEELSDTRHSQRSNLQRLVDSIEQWLLSGGQPGGMVLYEGAAPVLKKGEAITDAIEGRRRRLRELAADQHRVRSAPYPSALAKAKMRAQINDLADRGCPQVLGLIEDGTPITFSTTQVPALVYNSTPGAVVAPIIPDCLALAAWLHRDALLKALDKEIADCADDAAALTDEQRQTALAQIAGDTLAVERDEVGLIEVAASQGINVGYRPDTSPLAVLGLTLVTAPAAAPDTSSGWVREIRR